MSKTILVIEDNRDVRENIAEILELSGYQVIKAENGKIGADFAVKQTPDLVLCDIMMPELDGYGVHHILSRNHRTAHIPFIYLTAKAEKDDIRRGMSMGADDYITKPFDDVQLLNTIEARIAKSERLRHASDPQMGSLDLLLDEARAFAALRQLADNKESRHVNKRQVVYQEGDTPRWLYYIEKGQVKITRTTDDGRDLIVKIAKPGDFLGFLSLLREEPYAETAIAFDEADMRLIPQQDFLKLIYHDPNVAAAFLKMLANNVSIREQAILDMAYSSVRRRVANALVYLHDSGLNPVHLMRDDLAALAGIAKETAIRTLTDFKTEGLVQVADGLIHILKPEKLRAMPN
jgi:CRP/FNR family transcriptional regulator, polysaccharide utilization system transcription regulator